MSYRDLVAMDKEYHGRPTAPSTPAPPHPEYGSSNLLDAPLPDKCEEHPWAPFISNGTKGWICFSCWDHKLLEEAESTLAGERESRKQAEARIARLEALLREEDYTFEGRARVRAALYTPLGTPGKGEE